MIYYVFFVSAICLAARSIGSQGYTIHLSRYHSVDVSKICTNAAVMEAVFKIIEPLT